MDSQFKKGLLELCVLGIVYNKDCYGYELVEEVSKIINISSGTLYPLLKRLQNDKHLDYYIMESISGPPRKYYKITTIGKNYFKKQRDEWFEISNSTSNFLRGVENNGHE
ncbi:PadR family transcriptional regulator [Clostridium estertheticum]|uniref:PadR family transcriptional regulator n=1 Tax=Clostridium estertheticum subsp. estertheticum TaxID=1552 RepID=A0A1J0GBM0_9CLOT|nr:PadR family transcriptional regulator [Clostridium estertheticum]APC38730.1 PadR family transcriptional regulator [Clostridium estertheticum subsp. estertheticum]MBU3074661.1 PadR family transcriptional regulator [Clostridium estertheticum]MBU3164627.1 PadR family transcriptional regulator [Clostridium estertheticum]MBU3185546.1 PadR family transcriptional regulator [Clostridium estertheticum]MBX4261621.1 PadR family transcriptional regulator [Clostridium estertheticum]